MYVQFTLRLRGHEKELGTSRSTLHNPQGNGLVERYNGTI